GAARGQGREGFANCAGASRGRRARARRQRHARTSHPRKTSGVMPEHRNPILPGFHADPSIVRAGGDYYLVTSRLEYFPGLPVYRSRDLVSWKQVGNALTRTSQLRLAGQKSSKGIFAPTIRYHDGTFYMVTTNIENGGSFYVTTKDPAGEWSDPIFVGEK